ncbi:HAD-IA family hydrolase [Anaeroselena agilis]|uniref:HAD-IA family hydrolase n=1 Tax=Anaeroselena agilis TaxID=3063788 RepID=A0ABU3NYU7_9FIRM|nr:HAD-IA family hydrolase [Selenomonadales bacterium 4137-cl]
MSYKGILFDLDGTLLDTTDLILKSFQHTIMTHRGCDADMELVKSTFGRPLIEALALMGDDPEAMIKTYREYNIRYHDELAKVFTGVVEVVRKLYDEGVRLAVVTSKTRVTSVRGLRLFDLDKYFPVVIGHEDCQKHKPHPEPVLRALTALGLPAGDCLMVGDSPYDIMSARAAAVKTAAVRWTYVPWKDVAAAGPDHVIEDMAELVALCGIKDY